MLLNHRSGLWVEEMKDTTWRDVLLFGDGAVIWRMFKILTLKNGAQELCKLMSDKKRLYGVKHRK